MRAMKTFLERLGQLTLLVFETLYYIVTGKVELKPTIKQMVALGVESLPIACIISGFTGMVFSLQVSQEFDKFGAASLIGQLLAMAIIRELAPVLTGVVVAGRAGSAIAAEIGTMKVTEQVDALRALASSPAQYLVAPRLLACAIMVPILTIFGIIMGLLGGYVVAVYQVGVIPQVFYESAIAELGLYDLFVSLFKGFVFGMMIVVISCYKGLYAERGAQGVGDATISSVVSGMIALFIANYFLTALFY